MIPPARFPRKKPPFGFYVVLVFVGILTAVAVGDRIQSGTWGMGVGILCMVVMGLALILASSVYFGLESAYHRWKQRQENARNRKP